MFSTYDVYLIYFHLCAVEFMGNSFTHDLIDFLLVFTFSLVSFFFTFIILNTYSGRDECFVVLQRQYFCLTPHFSEPTQIFSEPDCIFCILSTQNTPFRGVLKLCLVTSFLSRNRRKCHLRGPRFQNFLGGACPQTPLAESHLRCDYPAFGGTIIFS